MPAHKPASWHPRRLDCRPFVAAVYLAVAPVGAQSIVSTGDLSFGSFAAISGGAGGTIVVAPNGSRSAPSGGVMLIANATSSAATFTVTGTPGAAYSISLPVDSTVSLTDGNGHSMAINGFASNPSATGTLFAGTQVLSVGATLSFGSNQVPGNYSGDFNVTVNYP